MWIPEAFWTRSLSSRCWASYPGRRVECQFPGLPTDDRFLAEKIPTRDCGFPVLRRTALHDERLDLAERKVAARAADEAARFLVENGDFFISRCNGSPRLVGVGDLAVMILTLLGIPTADPRATRQ